jgi:hypothetical protein
VTLIERDDQAMNVLIVLGLVVVVGLASYVIGYAHGRRSGLDEARAVAVNMATNESTEPEPGAPMEMVSVLDATGRVRRDWFT